MCQTMILFIFSSRLICFCSSLAALLFLHCQHSKVCASTLTVEGESFCGFVGHAPHHKTLTLSSFDMKCNSSTDSSNCEESASPFLFLLFAFVSFSLPFSFSSLSFYSSPLSSSLCHFASFPLLSTCFIASGYACVADSCSLTGPICVAALPSWFTSSHWSVLSTQEDEVADDPLRGEWIGYELWTGFAPSSWAGFRCCLYFVYSPLHFSSREPLPLPALSHHPSRHGLSSDCPYEGDQKD